MHDLSARQSADGTYWTRKYEAVPYYVPPTLWNRYGPAAWGPRLMGLPLPGDGTLPVGYKIGEMGPEAMRGKGERWMGSCVDGLKGVRSGGCIFGGKADR